MNIGELREELARQDQDRYVVLRDPDTGRIYSLQFLIQETAVYHGNQDLRCGPHNLTYRPSDKDRSILHLGQQGWYGDYPQTPNVETVAKLADELGNYPDQETPTVLTHHFDEFVDVDLLLPIDDTGRPMIWGHPGSSTRAWPREAREAPPDRVLLIGNTENEAYAQLKEAMRDDLDARVLLLQADRPSNTGKETFPIAERQVTKEELQQKQQTASEQLRQAWLKLGNAVTKPQSQTRSELQQDAIPPPETGPK